MNIKLANTNAELSQILILQESNLLKNSFNIKEKSNGFVTVKHNLSLLQKMNEKAKQVIATDEENVIGYALVMLKEFKNFIPILIPMFTIFEKISFQNKIISDYNYYVMGQVCIADSFRGKGVFKQLYLKHKEVYSKTFDICITEVSSSNLRSIRAHEKVGFKTIHTFKDTTDEWNIMVWNWQ